MTEKNPLAGWVIVCVDGLRLVGAMTRSGEVIGLSPAYEYRCDVVPVPIQTPKGAALVPQLIRQMTPIHGDPGIEAYPLRNDAVCIGLDTLPDESQREYMALIDSVRSGIARAKAAQAGIQVVGG